DADAAALAQRVAEPVGAACCGIGEPVQALGGGRWAPRPPRHHHGPRVRTPEDHFCETNDLLRLFLNPLPPLPRTDAWDAGTRGGGVGGGTGGRRARASAPAAPAGTASPGRRGCP